MHAGHERHDGGGSDGDVLAAAEHAVHEAAHEGGVEAVLGRQPGNDGIGDTLGKSEVSIRVSELQTICRSRLLVGRLTWGMTVRPTVRPAMRSEMAKLRL